MKKIIIFLCLFANNLSFLNYVLNRILWFNEGSFGRKCLFADSLPVTYTFLYTGAVQNLTVPIGASYMYVDISGAAGGNAGSSLQTPGYGARVRTHLLVQPSDTVYHVYVGGAGGNLVGGWNGGGRGYNAGNGGGGGSDIRVGGSTLSHRMVMAGGGGACFNNANCGTLKGGNGGLNGTSGTGSCGGSGTGGRGATIARGGDPGFESGNAVLPTAGTLGQGGNGASNTYTGGGGGGYYGGGGAAYSGCGGGGSSFSPADPSAVYTSAFQHSSGNASITFFASPSSQPSTQPSRAPSAQPSVKPTNQPTSIPTTSLRTLDDFVSNCYDDVCSIQGGISCWSNHGSADQCCPSSSSGCWNQVAFGNYYCPHSNVNCVVSCNVNFLSCRNMCSYPFRCVYNGGTGYISPGLQCGAAGPGQGTFSCISFPSSQPSSKPTQPSSQPSSNPSSQPTDQPSRPPTSQPTSEPSNLPSVQPSRQPTSFPTMQPTSLPSHPVHYFGFTGTVQNLTVPVYVSEIIVTAAGAGGGCIGASRQYGWRGGYGAKVQTLLSVTPQTVLHIFVGEQGSLTTLQGGYNGGGNGANTYCGGGGGASDIRMGGMNLANRVVVAGGAGGCGQNANGGDGGAIGHDGGSDGSHPVGTGGTLTAGGKNSYGGGGAFGGFGYGSAAYDQYGGGGGSGYYGGNFIFFFYVAFHWKYIFIF
jgi:hypothetical protein